MTNSTPASPLERVHDLLTLYGDPAASVAALLCDDHPAGQVAYTVVEPGLTSVPLTFGQLREGSERFAAALAGLGIGAGDRVATLMGKSADYLTALLGIWRAGAVHVPLFTAFAPPAIAMRLAGSGAKVVVCDQSQRPKLDPGDDIPAGAPWRIIVAGLGTGPAPRGGKDPDFAALLARHKPGMPAAALGGEAPIVHVYTSGTTGLPKAVVVPARALASFRTYLEFACDLRPDDLYWNAADPDGPTGCTSVSSAP